MLATLLLMAASAPGPACGFDPEEGAVVLRAEATPPFEARHAPEFTAESFTYDGALYRKTGTPQTMAPAGLAAFDLISSVPLFIEPGDYQARVIYLMVDSAACVFQRYEKE